MTKEQNHLHDLVISAIIAALYVALTYLSQMFGLGYGAVQLRLSEMLNCLVVFNKRYIWGVTLGCILANLTSTLGVVDIVWGSLQTLISLTIIYFVSKKLPNLMAKLGSVVVIGTVMMFLIAWELVVLTKAPFWLTYGSVAAGEFASLLVGAILIYYMSKRIDFNTATIKHRA
ncbi:QueT transporter family protein [Lapidilactobacillus wuchangensis]|jgi:Predicted membrane protein|uniref:QueT transporter family protein n=1 Tax=Lapidilactobacillus wuchangensis TaxID=2486001 RepID=UPI000F771ED1|nr:QueT transporter family protein [Lapidilactobacillus wuchangensis]